jgi:hypothetical protein
MGVTDDACINVDWTMRVIGVLGNIAFMNLFRARLDSIMKVATKR